MSKTSPIRQKMLDWQDDLLGLASCYVLGFDIFGGGDDSAALQDIQDKLSQIQSTLKQISDKLDSIAAEIQQLPSILAGIVNESQARNWLISAKADADTIADKTVNLQTYSTPINKAAVDATVSDLEKSIDGVWGSLGPTLQPAILTAPQVATWAQAKALLLRDPDINPSHFTVRDTKFYKGLKINMYAFMDSTNRSENTAIQNYGAFPTKPEAGWVYDHLRGFVEVSMVPSPGKQRYGATDDGQFVLLATHATSSGSVALLPADTPGVAWLDPKNVASARSAWQQGQPVVKQAAFTLRYLAHAGDAFAALKRSLV